MTNFCDEYSLNNSLVKTLPVVKCSFLELIQLQKFNYTDLYNSEDFLRENKNHKVIFKCTSRIVNLYTFSFLKDLNKILTFM